MTQDEIIELALKVDLMGHQLAYSDWYKNRLKAFGKLVAEKEREACAKVCEEYETNNDIADTWLNIVSEVIRARGQA